MSKESNRLKISKKINSYKITQQTKSQIFDFLDNCNEFMIDNLDHNLDQFISQNHNINTKNNLLNNIKVETKQWVTELMLEIYASKKNITASYIELYLERGKINSNTKKEKLLSHKRITANKK